MRYFEKQAINSSPVMRLAVRYKRMFGLGTEEAIRAAKKTEKGLKPKLISRIFGATTKNRLDILQNELKTAKTPGQRGLDNSRFPVKKVYENDKLISSGRNWREPKRYKG